MNTCCGRDERGFFVRDRVHDFVQGADVIHHILRVPAIRCKAVMTMTSFWLTIVETDSVASAFAIDAMTTALVTFNRDTIAHLKLSHALTHGDDLSTVFMPRNKRPIVRHWVPTMPDQTRISTTNRARVHFQEHFQWTGGRDRIVLDS